MISLSSDDGSVNQYLDDLTKNVLGRTLPKDIPFRNTFDATSPAGMALLFIGEMVRAGRISLPERHMLEQVIRPVALAEYQERFLRQEADAEPKAVKHSEPVAQ